MASDERSSPRFGKADLSNCEREQIHFAGSIQPFGTLLLVREPDLTVMQASGNAKDFLDLDRSVLGRRLSDLPGNLHDRVSPHLEDRLADGPVAVRCTVGRRGVGFDGLVHRPAGGGLVIELEHAGPNVDLPRHLKRALDDIRAAASLDTLCDQAAEVFSGLTRYDRVMIYRFDDEGHGQVVAERRQPHLEAFLGNWYPASDIPQIARRLYERNRVRILADVASEPIPLEPRLSPISGQDLDMSMCVLRSMSPLHIQYLKNMGVAATLVVSLMVGGKLWGLVACHHDAPRIVHFEVRAVCELLAEAMATRIVALEAFAQAQAELAVRRLEQRMAHSIAKAGDWRAALFDRSQALLVPLDAQGVALLLDGEVVTAGDVPGTQSIRDLGTWLADRGTESLFATPSLRRDAPALSQGMPETGGLVAVPISDTPGDYLIWFRVERKRTVTWGGDPTKPFTVGNDPSDLSPRRSFAQWHQLVEGTCEAWTPPDLRTARLIGETVADVVLQVRSLRILVVEDQLASVRAQVRASPQPVLIADAEGQVLLINDAFEHLLAGAAAPGQMAQLADFFEEPSAVERSLRDLMVLRRSWRGEAVFQAGAGSVPLLVRADPILASPGRVLGFVLLFIDISGRRAVEGARRRFQEGIVAPHRFGAARLAAASHPIYHALLSTIVDNAQLAAFEIADGIDMAAVPDTLDTVRSSVSRAAAVLERLVWHATRAANDDG